MRRNSVVLLGSSGCFLPLAIFFNFFFGWVYLGLKLWLISEIILILWFILLVKLSTKNLETQPRKRSNVIDVKSEIED